MGYLPYKIFQAQLHLFYIDSLNNLCGANHVSYLKFLNSFQGPMLRNNSLKQILMLFLGMKAHEDIISPTDCPLFRR